MAFLPQYRTNRSPPASRPSTPLALPVLVPPPLPASPRAGRSGAACVARSAELGFNVLLQLFERHELVRGDVLTQCFNRILTHSASVPRVVRLLRKLVEQRPVSHQTRRFCSLEKWPGSTRLV